MCGVGADLAPGTLLAAYRRGLFPMHLDGRARVLAWWSPDPRGILPLDGLRMSRSLRRSLPPVRAWRVDTDFAAVIKACAGPRPTGGHWIHEGVIDAYTELHRLGWAHSVEAYDVETGVLAGGLYGVAIGGLFAGESMFHRARDASKVALVGARGPTAPRGRARHPVGDAAPRVARRRRHPGARVPDPTRPRPHTAAARGVHRGVTASARLGARTPFDGDGLLRFLALRAVPGVESVTGAVYERDGVTIAFDADGVDVDGGTGIDGVDATAQARRLLDLDADPVGDRRTARRRRGRSRRSSPPNPGVRVPGAWSGFEVAVRAVVGQQVTLAAARTLLGRVVDRCGGGRFPEPDALAGADLDGIGMPGARVRTLRTVARAVRDGDIDLDGAMPAEAVTDALLALPGIGGWTASYVAMRALGDRDAFPAGDVGLRNAAAPPRTADRTAAARRPRRTVAALAVLRHRPPLALPGLAANPELECERRAFRDAGTRVRGGVQSVARRGRR